MDFGRTHLYCHFRTLDHRDVVITQRRLFEAVKRANPEGVRRRLSQHIRARKKLRVSATLRNSGWTYRRLVRPQILPYKSRILWARTTYHSVWRLVSCVGRGKGAVRGLVQSGE